MLRHLLTLVVAGTFATIMAVPAAAQDTASDGVFAPVGDAELQWEPIQPPGFDPGMEIAAINGDPGEDGGAYTLRLRFEDGYRFPPHFHPKAENLTVLEGTLLFSMGEEADEERLETYSPGDFLYIAGEHPHFGGARGETVIQLHGEGPFDIIVVGSPEDTR